jgi:hypothetical protein
MSGYSYHSVDGISYSLAQSEPIKAASTVLAFYQLLILPGILPLSNLELRIKIKVIKKDPLFFIKKF